MAKEEMDASGLCDERARSRALCYYSNIPKSPHIYRLFPFEKASIHCVDKVTLNGKNVTRGCFGLLSIFGFGYVDCYSINEFDLPGPTFRLEDGEIAREPRRYGRVKVTLIYIF